MKDCDQDIRGYHSDRVALTEKQRADLRARRDANRRRVENGLEANDDPVPEEFVIQGSYAMRTTIQERGNDYDIDDGAVFSEESLEGARGADMSALDARKMVREAADDGSFKQAPEIKPNCVRVFYNDGPHVDIPVYRRLTGGDDFELAGPDWKVSDPKGVNSWFKDCLERHCTDGRTQFRQVIRLLKSLCKSRPSYSLPSGFVLTVLSEECYYGLDERLDRAVRDVIISVRDRLRSDLTVKHPVVDEWLISSDDDSKSRKLRELLDGAAEDLDVLSRPNCTRSMALKAWKKVFNTDYFDDEIEAASKAAMHASSIAVAGLPASRPKPYGLHDE